MISLDRLQEVSEVPEPMKRAADLLVKQVVLRTINVTERDKVDPTQALVRIREEGLPTPFTNVLELLKKENRILYEQLLRSVGPPSLQEETFTELREAVYKCLLE